MHQELWHVGGDDFEAQRQERVQLSPIEKLFFEQSRVCPYRCRTACVKVRVVLQVVKRLVHSVQIDSSIFFLIFRGTAMHVSLEALYNVAQI